MIKKMLLPFATLSFAGLVLLFSLKNASEVSFNVSRLSKPLPQGPTVAERFYVDYKLPEVSGSSIPVIIQANSVLDRLRLVLENRPGQKALMKVDFANKRLITAERFIREGRVDEGLILISKAQVYLGESYDLVSKEEIFNKAKILQEISIAALKHRERIEILMAITPDNVSSLLFTDLEKAKRLYDKSKVALQTIGEAPPKSPFE